MSGVYPYNAAELAAISRLSVSYNSGNYNASTNPYGFGQGGHVVNFINSLADEAVAAEATSAAADAAATSAAAAVTSETNAALSAAKLQGTSTTSLTVSAGSKSITTQASKQFAAGLYVTIYSAANPTTNVMGGQVTSYSGTALVVNVTAIGSGSGNTAADWVISVAGSPGGTGTTGAPGAQGATPAVQMTFSTAVTASDPGSGVVKFNNATIASVTALYVDNVDNSSNSITSWLDSFDDSTTTGLRGQIHIRQLSDTTKWALFNVTGPVTDSTGYRTVVVTYVAGVLPDNNAVIGIVFARAGDKGSDGAGAGDLVSIETSVTDGHIILFNGTTGKSAKTAGAGIGTSGTNLGKLDANVTYSGTRTFAATADFQQQFKLSGDISPTQIAANTDDYAPTGITTATVLRLTTDASRNLTGITGGADGRVLLLINVGSNNLVLKDEVTSTAANRFSFGADVTLGAKQAAFIWYDSTSSRWRLGHPFIAGASGHTVPYLDGTNTWSGAQSVAAKLDAQQDFYRSGDISPTQIAANTNDYNPTGLSTASVLRLSTDASRNLTGLQGGADGRVVTLINVGSNPLVLKNADTGSSAANRFLFGADLVLGAEQAVTIWYDSTSTRWRAMQDVFKATVVIQKFAASGTYTPSTGMLYAIIECYGGGGGGGGVAGSATYALAAGGGGAGGYSRSRKTAAEVGASQAVTIGAAGTAGASGSNNGGAGGDTSVGALVIGKGGSGGAFASTVSQGTPGNGGVAGTGDVPAPGANGNPGFYWPGVPAGFSCQFGKGADSPLGGGGVPGFANASTVAGAAATGFAAGGGGAQSMTTASNAAGGAGAPGYVIITETCDQ